ncbi:MAG: OadG family protein [Firmicutes bacterium]|jgi:sodium pump decarboxylase gamma subunit|nr:OadG family protein [Bacillota bacterium]
MANLGLLEKFADPEIMMTLTTGEKVTASLMVTVLGMGITFAALVVIWGVIALMSKLMAPKVINEPVVIENKIEDNDDELIAVISAAVATSMNTSEKNIVIKKIRKSGESISPWSSPVR